MYVKFTGDLPKLPQKNLISKKTLINRDSKPLINLIIMRAQHIHYNNYAYSDNMNTHTLPYLGTVDVGTEGASQWVAGHLP